MGYGFKAGASKADAVAEVIAPCSGEDGAGEKTIAHCVRGNSVYAVREYTKGDKTIRYVMVALLAKSKGFGWGYKAMEEASGPYYYACPVSYLDMCTEPVNEYSAKWRDKVRARAALRKVSVGDKVNLANGWLVEITGLKPLRCSHEGRNYKLHARLIVSKEAA